MYYKSELYKFPKEIVDILWIIQTRIPIFVIFIITLQQKFFAAFPASLIGIEFNTIFFLFDLKF